MVVEAHHHITHVNTAGPCHMLVADSVQCQGLSWDHLLLVLAGLCPIRPLDAVLVSLQDLKVPVLPRLVEHYQLEEEQRQLLESRLEELVLAVGPELSSNMVVDMKACPPPPPPPSPSS